MLISKEKLIKRLDAEMVRVRARLEKEIRECKTMLRKEPDFIDYWNRRLDGCQKRLEKARKGYSQLPGMAYRPRLGIFAGSVSMSRDGGRLGGRNADRTYDFNPETGVAHSYDWYELGKVINGMYVVNAYHYSSQTASHYCDLMRTLDILGIKYVTLDAPSGLQDLSGAQGYYLFKLGQTIVANKYARKHKSSIKWIEEGFATLAKLGIKTTKAMREAAIKDAENKRQERLEDEKRQRLKDKFGEYAKALQEGDLQRITAQTARLAQTGLLDKAQAYAASQRL